MSRCIFLLAGIFAFVLGYAQCPDSVRVYVYPEVICPGEVVHLSTDSTRLHCVNIGDIICVNSNTQDTAIVSPSDWTLLGLASSYSPLSVVFFVDSTCRHGWAVQCDSTFKDSKWTSLTLASCTDIEGINNLPANRTAFFDIHGDLNTAAIQSLNSSNYPMFNQTHPFYVPAIGQLNYLYAEILTIDNSLHLILGNSNFTLLNYSNWWSSTESNVNPARQALYLKDGIVASQNKTSNPSSKKNYVLPVMNF